MATKRGQFGISFDVLELEKAANSVASVGGDRLGKAVVRSLNEVSAKLYDTARKRMIENINLTDDYLQSHMEVRPATESNLKATVTAFGGRGRGTPASRYPNSQLVQDVNWSNERIKSMGRKFGKWPGWTERKGDPSRGISANRKSAGVKVDVRKSGTARSFEHGFLMPLRAGKATGGNGQGLFVRSKSGEMRHVYGPAVYQLFRHVSVGLEQEVDDDLRESIIRNIDAEVEKAFST